MAKKVILGTDIARDAFKVKVNENFTELYDKDVAIEEQINSLEAEPTEFTIASDATYTYDPASKYYKKNGWVYFTILVSRVDANTFAKTEVIFTLPVGFRPINRAFLSGVGQSGSTRDEFIPVNITTSGNVTILIATTRPSLNFSGVFYVGGGTV